MGSERNHAETVLYNKVWGAAKEAAVELQQEGEDVVPAALFAMAVSGSSVVCAGHKASCFLCAAIAHCLGMQVEKKDTRSFGDYSLPDVLQESPSFFSHFVGAEAYTEFLKLSPAQQREIYVNFGSELYNLHRGTGKNFSTQD